MKLINSSFEILEQTPGIQGIKKQIEKAGRTCYKSEDKITDTSCEEFVNRMVNSGHGAMLEHGTVYLNIPCKLDYNDYGDITWVKIKSNSSYEEYEENPYTKVELVKHGFVTEGNIYITTNYRVLVENGWLDDLQYQCEPTEYHEKRITVKFILPISISREFIRHRTASFAEQSTRYCNYTKDKFDNQLAFIKPYWCNLELGTYSVYDPIICKLDEKISEKDYTFFMNLSNVQVDYNNLISAGHLAQEAREILPLCTKTELVMTAFISDWKHFFELRCHSTAHPQARELAIPLKEEFINRNYI